MSYGPAATMAEVIADDEAAAILRHHLPEVFEVVDVRLSPFLTLADLSLRIGGAGAAPPNLTSMWRELAAVPSGPAPRAGRQAPAPPVPDYEDADVAPASARIRAIPPAQRWGIAELVIDGPAHGNPFVDVDLRAVFRCTGEEILVGGFYDGAGTYRIRFHPPISGTWSFETRSNARSLDGVTGTVDVAPPAPGDHGPVGVRDTFHFAHADGTPYRPWGTTLYAWTHQSPELEEQTLRTLAGGPFNKVRMCVFPKSFDFNTDEPPRYPYERDSTGEWDFTRFDVGFFRHLEQRIRGLHDLRIQADVILFHPYDRWGFSRMPAWADDLYAGYVVRRLAAFGNVWWSLANEYDFARGKTGDDWERIAEVIQREDHVGHLRSIHNGFTIYDHRRPWITHCSLQKVDAYRTTENTGEWRDRYRKPVVVDECGYEGDIEWSWGNLSGPELVRRCWEGAVRGGYVTHGETYDNDREILWWAKGGVLTGDSPRRIGFLAAILAEAPSGRYEPLPADLDAPWGGDTDHRLVYLGFHRPRRRTISTPPGTRWDVDVIDTWNMTVETLPGVFEGRFTVRLPGREYMAIRLRRATPRPRAAT